MSPITCKNLSPTFTYILHSSVHLLVTTKSKVLKALKEWIQTPKGTNFHLLLIHQSKLLDTDHMSYKKNSKFQQPIFINDRDCLSQ